MRNTVSRLLPGLRSNTKRIIHEFAEQSELVYFGYVSQRDDDHHIVRGVTVSTKHTDDHYCIGTYKSYDVVFVERTDLIQGKPHSWHIVEIDLKAKTALPHMFIASRSSRRGFEELLRMKYPTLHAEAQVVQDPSFQKHMNLFVSPAYMHDIQLVLNEDDFSMIGSHFQGIDIEIIDDHLYLYSEKSAVTAKLLQTMLENGMWLANVLDTKNQPSRTD